MSKSDPSDADKSAAIGSEPAAREGSALAEGVAPEGDGVEAAAPAEGAAPKKKRASARPREAKVAAIGATSKESSAPKKRESRTPRARKSKVPPALAICADVGNPALAPMPLPSIDRAPPPRARRRRTSNAPASIATLPAPALALPLDSETHDAEAELRAGMRDRDDLSVPPAVADIDAEGAHLEDALATDFFTAPTLLPCAAHVRYGAEADPIEEDARVLRKRSVVAAKRREQFGRYVLGAVAACAMLCLVAFITGRARHESIGLASAAEVSQPRAEPAEPAPLAGDSVAPAIEDSPLAQPEPAIEPEVDVLAAKQEKRRSQAALERLDVPKAIDLGEQSVAHDPTDAEAWLILGAAYQAKGDATNMRRAFRECIAQGRGGRRSECAQFPH